MINRSILMLLVLSHASCATRKAKSGFEDIADFGLSEDGLGTKVDDRAYFDDLKRSESSVAFESSLPLPLRVGKSGDSFDSIPSLAKPGVESRLSVSVGPCSFTLLSGPVQFDRYLLAGSWIKLTEGLPSKTPVKLEPNQDLNIKAVTKIGIEISETMAPGCKRMFEGRKFFIGRFHLNRSRLGLISAPGAPSIAFGAKSVDPQGKSVFLHWQSGSNLPTVIDDFDFPATAESGIFRAQMAAKGYYYLAWQTVLRMDKIQSMVIKLPFNGSLPPARTPISGPSRPPVPSAQAAAKAMPPRAPSRSINAPSRAGSPIPPTKPSSTKPTSHPALPAAQPLVLPDNMPPGLKSPAVPAKKPSPVQPGKK